MLSFHKKEKGQALAWLESRYSNAKAWTSKFFFNDGRGWELPDVEEILSNFSVRAICSPVLDHKSL